CDRAPLFTIAPCTAEQASYTAAMKTGGSAAGQAAGRPVPARRRRHGALAWLLFAAASSAYGEPADVSDMPQHPLERRALTEPDAVLAQLPAELDAARA